MRSRSVAWVALLAWLVLAIAGIATAYRMRTWDFAVFRIAAERFLAGSELYRAADQDMPFKYPPFAAALLAVIGFGSERLPAVLWNLGSMLALLWVIRAALPQIRGGDEAESPFVFTPEGALWAGAILLHPLLFELRRGQADLFVLGAVTAAAVLAATRPWVAGGLAAVAIALKLPAALLVLYLVRFRHWRALVALGTTVVVLEIVVLSRYGVAGGIAAHESWWRVLTATTPERVMSTQGWIPLILLAARAPPASGMLLVQVVASAILVAILLARRGRRDTWFASLTLAMAGLSPLCWNPNYVLAFPALVRMFNRAQELAQSRRSLVIGTGLAAALLLTTLTPGIVAPDVYQRAVSTYRPYAWLSLLLLVATVAGKRSVRT